MTSGRQHGRDRFAVEATGTGLSLQNLRAGGSRERAAMRAGFGHRVVDVGGGENPGRHRQRLGVQAVRVTRAVQSLVVQSGQGTDLGERCRSGQDALRQVRVGAHPFPLTDIPVRGFVPHRGRNSDAAEIVH